MLVCMDEDLRSNCTYTVSFRLLWGEMIVIQMENICQFDLVECPVPLDEYSLSKI